MFKAIISFGTLKKALVFPIFLLAVAGTAFPGTEKDFLSDLERVRRLMASGRWSSAGKKLDQLLERHERQDYALARRIEIQDCALACAFWKSYKPPKPSSVVSGDLVSYNASSGSIKLRYTPKTIQDFEVQKVKSSSSSAGRVRYVHPAVFTGTYTIEVKGKRYASMSSQIYVCQDPTHSYCINFGCKALEPIWVRPGIHLWKDGEWCELDSKEASPAETNKPYHFKVTVSTSTISAHVGRKLLLKSKKEKGLYGSFSLKGFEFDEIIVRGKVEPSWIQGLLDKAASTARARFEKGYVTAEHLPAWFLEKRRLVQDSDYPSKADSAKEKGYPGPVLPGQENMISRAMDLLEKDRLDEGLDFARSLSQDEVTPAVREFLLVLFLTEQERYDEALEHCSRVCELDSGFFRTQQLRAMLYRHLGRRKKAIEAFSNLLESFPSKKEVYTELAYLFLNDGRPREAKAIYDQGLRRGLQVDEDDSLNEFLLKALNGPDWGRVYQYRSRHYHVFSDMDYETCVKAAQLLEESYVAYKVYLKWIPELEKKKFRVYLFSGCAGFQDYYGDLMGDKPPHFVAGSYSTRLKQLLIWNLPDSRRMMETVRHEGFHQYLDRLMENPPRWFNEGLAEYYEKIRRVNGQWNFGKIRNDHVQVLKRSTPLSLDEFLHLSDREFLSDTRLTYAQSWAFVHFLRHSSRKNRALFKKLFDILQTDASTKEALEEVFGDEDLDSLQKEFEAYLRELG